MSQKHRLVRAAEGAGEVGVVDPAAFTEESPSIRIPADHITPPADIHYGAIPPREPVDKVTAAGEAMAGCHCGACSQCSPSPSTMADGVEQKGTVAAALAAARQGGGL